MTASPPTTTNAVVGTVATVGDGVGDGAAVVANGKVPSATPTDIFSLDSRFRGNDGAVVVGGGVSDNDGAVVAGTVATVNDGVGDGAVATDTGDGRRRLTDRRHFAVAGAV